MPKKNKKLAFSDQKLDISLIQGDAVKEISSILDNSVNLVLTDPPYNLGLFMKKRETNLGAMRKNHFSASNWDLLEEEEWKKSMDRFFEECSRVLVKKGAMIIFMSLIKLETIIKIAESNNFYYKSTGIWHKTNPMPRNKDLHFINSTEAWIYFINDGKTGIFNNKGKLFHDFYESSNINPSEKKMGAHPTQKPIKLMDHFINLLTNPGDMILDPFMGSGSSGVSAVKRHRKFIGIDSEEQYLKIAKKRIIEATGEEKFS